jgi:nucleolar GTP-binding protein
LLKSLQVDSDDEAFAAEAQKALEFKKVSQDQKKMKNRPVMPRTAGLRTMSEMSRKLTAAGLDPSRIEARAEILAKAAKAKATVGKRKREDADMEVDGSDAGSDWADEDEMDVDESGPNPGSKRVKTNSGSVVAQGKRVPNSNRQLAGMRNAEVSLTSPLIPVQLSHQSFSTNSKPRKQSNFAISVFGKGICMPKQERVTVRSVLRWCV